MKWKIREIEIDNPVVLAPMAGVGNLAFRVITKQMGTGLIYAEMVSDSAVNYRNAKTLDMLKVDPIEHPMTMQIFGSDPEKFVEAAKYVNDNCECDIVDINMGCPVPKVTKNEAGARLLLNPNKVYELVSRVVEAIDKPLTVKIRTGWDHKTINAVENALMIEKAGASALAIHGRTRSDQYTGRANWDIIRDVKAAVKSIPVIGNGDITSPEEFERAMKHSGVDGVMVGRAALGNPWVLKRMVHYHQTGEHIPDPTISERIAVAVDHMDRLIDLKGDRVALMEMRSHMAWYMKGLPGASKVKKELVMSASREQTIDLLKQFEAYVLEKQQLTR